MQKVPTGFPNLTVAERQKRLLPYINFYVAQNLQQPPTDDYHTIRSENLNHQPLVETKFGELLQTTYQPNTVYQVSVTPYQPKTKFTPFLETNALPGPFVPMARPQLQKIRVGYTPIRQGEKLPNYSTIYEKLSQIKLQHMTESPAQYQTQKNALQYFHRKPQVNYIPLQQLRETPTPPKTFIHTYTPTSIDIPMHDDNYRTQEIGPGNHVVDEYVNGQVTPQPIRLTHLNKPKHHFINPDLIQINPKPSYVPLFTVNPQSHYIVQEHKQYHNQNHNQYLQEVIPRVKPLLVVQPQGFQSILTHNEIKETKPILLHRPHTTADIPINYHHQSENIENPATEITLQNHESPNSLSNLLKKLQDSNTLPQTLTADNIDNSIKTLINILNSFKKTHKLTSPIIVADTEPDFNDGLNENDGTDSITQTFPANTPEGGTPGRPGIDYPALSIIPHTNFDCQTQRYKGFFADPDTNCQVWHYCDLNGGQASFLCPNGTIFSQVALTCDWWFNVKCSTTTQLYVLNERLYKYIIPLKPKFPEDYTGPLVDKYLALKFQEMEEKLKKENKGKENDKKEEVDKLQMLEGQTEDSQSHTTEPYKSHK